ncbi:hypothetical protein H5410_047204 [Solanum commersonii]|uniref:Uncharacterized protein n=1 Tax=Solanum commersonii TaxID=4109 RepID=A0A9J5XGH7_SOLCO|nr:hypothetical protein H5410_047204 [Solanum commersonii]
MFEDSLSEDLKSFSNTERKNVRYKVLNHINDVLHSMGHDINEYNLVLENIRPSETTKDTKDIHFQRNIIVSEEDLLLPKKLNVEQLISYNTIIDRISSKKANCSISRIHSFSNCNFRSSSFCSSWRTNCSLAF